MAAPEITVSCNRLSSSATISNPVAPAGDDTPVILSVAFPFAPVGNSAVGGAEVILSQIEAALPTLGFRSALVAHAASQPQGRLYPTSVPEGEITDALRAAVEGAQQEGIDRALAENSIALVHMHGLDFHRYRIPAHLPVVVTLHLPPAWYPKTIWSLPANFHFLCVSETERGSCPEPWRERITVIQNGVSLPESASLRAEGKYALMLSRICAEKNLHTGLDAARLAGLPAMLAGETFPYEAHQRYFAEEIEPRLTRSGHAHADHAHASAPLAEARFLGPVAGAAKARLLAHAACLLLPSLAPETSSLVAMEALAAGVPVIALASGAVPEIVDHGRTGFLIPPEPGGGPEAVRALAEAMAQLPTLDRRACRAAAEERFSAQRMLQSYGKLYRQLALKVPARTTIPQAGLSPPSLNVQAALTADFSAADPATPATLVEEVTASQCLTSLIPEWTALWSEDGNATPFQHPAWLAPWWRQFGPDGKLCALALRDSGNQRLQAFLPLYLYQQPQTGERQLLLLGAGTTDYLDGVWGARNAAAAAAATALDHLLLQSQRWDSAALHQLRPDSPLLIAGEARGGSVTGAEPCSLIDIAADLPAKLRANAGRYRRRAEANGSLRCTVAASSEEALSSFEHLVRLHRERWEGRGEAGVLTDPRVLAHHREAIPLLLAAGLLRLFRLTHKDQILGVLYALADPPLRSQRRLYLYLIGFNTQYADFSPGTLLFHEVWQYAQSQRFTHLDLLRGGEAYKQLWGACPEPTFALHLEPVRR